MSWLERVILRPPPFAVRAGIALSLVAIATVVRWQIDRGENGFTFATYLFLIVLAAAIFGWRVGVLTATASIVAVRFVFLNKGWFAGSGMAEFVIFACFLLAVGAITLVAESMRIMIIRNDEQKESIRVLNRELHHRSRNALQLLMAVVERGIRMENPKPYFAELIPRLAAWSKANDVLRYGEAPVCGLDELVEAGLASFDRGRIAWQGNGPQIDSTAATPLALAIHELATNSTKYGALSNTAGKVDITWSKGNGKVELCWTEAGGPPVVPPVRHGLGTLILEPRDGLEAVNIDYRPEGVVAVLNVRAG